ncbi:hypothetical protein SAMN05920897_111127, partial [Alkalispirochaeta americana]
EQISAAIGDISSVSDVNHSQIEEILRATGELKLASGENVAASEGAPGDRSR